MDFNSRFGKRNYVVSEYNNTAETPVNPHGFISVRDQVARFNDAGLLLETYRRGMYDIASGSNVDFVEPPLYEDPDFIVSTDAKRALDKATKNIARELDGLDMLRSEEKKSEETNDEQGNRNAKSVGST